MSLMTHFGQHVSVLQDVAAKALDAVGLDTLILTCGSEEFYYRDDAALPFRPSPMFAHWCPAEGQGHALVVQPGTRPQLHYYQPEDHWHEVPLIAGATWATSFDVKIHRTSADLWTELGRFRRVAFVGPETTKAREKGWTVDPPRLVARLEWQRKYKSDYEVACLTEAARLGGMGHQAVKRCFERMDASELDLYFQFFQGAGVRVADAAYDPIIGLNEHAAILHYRNQRTLRMRGPVLLIDAGIRVHGYNSDITRTLVRQDGVLPDFKALLQSVEALQARLCAQVQVGKSFAEIQHLSLEGVGEILLSSGLVRTGPTVQELLDRNIVNVFYPHGVGHLLGIQVHDIGGRWADPDGTQEYPKEPFPKLRTKVVFEPHMVITIEPGLYFNPVLLARARANPEVAGLIDWPKVDALVPMGGIRVEDDLLILERGSINLTRQFC